MESWAAALESPLTPFHEEVAKQLAGDGEAEGEPKEEALLEVGGPDAVQKQIREASIAGHVKDTAMGISRAYTAAGAKVAAVHALACAWARSSEGTAAGASLHLSTRLHALLERALAPEGVDTSLTSAISADPDLHRQLASRASPALGAALLGLARGATTVDSVSLLDYLAGSRGFWPHIPSALPHLLVRQPSMSDHRAALSHAVGLGCLTPSLPPAAGLTPASLHAPHTRLHLPTLTATLLVLITRHVYSALAPLAPTLLHLPGAEGGGAVAAFPCPPASHQAAATATALARVAHVLSVDEEAVRATKSPASPLPAHAGTKRYVPVGGATTPYSLLLQWAGVASVAPGLPPTPTWAQAADWAQRTAPGVLAAPPPLPSASPSSTAGASAYSRDEGEEEGEGGMSVVDFTAAVAKLSGVPQEGAPAAVQAVLAVVCAVGMGKGPATLVRAGPDPPAAGGGDDWRDPQSALDVLAAAHSNALAAAVLLRGCGPTLCLTGTDQSRPWLARCKALLAAMPSLVAWHPCLAPAVCDVVVSMLGAQAAAPAQGDFRRDVTDTPAAHLGRAGVEALLDLVGLGHAAAIAQHLCRASWNVHGEFARGVLAGVVQQGVTPPVSPALAQGLGLVLTVSRGDNGTSRRCWGGEFAAEHPRATARLFQLVVSSTSPPGARQGQLWSPRGLLGFGAAPWEHPEALWRALKAALAPCGGGVMG